MPFPGIIRKPLPEDLYHFSQIFSLCFDQPFEGIGTPAEYYEKAARNAEKSLQSSDVHYMDKYIAEYNGQVIGGMCAIPYTVRFDNNDASMCGVGGVVTLPPFRRLGSVRATFERLLRDELAKGTAFSFLYPFSQEYYEKFGFAQSEPTMLYTIAINKLKYEQDRERFSLYETEDDLAAFQTAYAEMRGYNMMVVRSRCDFAKVIEADPYRKNISAYLYRDGSGQPRGYMVFRKSSENGKNVMAVSELVFDSAETLRAVIGFAGTFASDFALIRFSAPACLNLEKLTGDQMQGEFSRVLRTSGMVRVIDVEKTLRLAAYRSSGTVRLAISDPTLDKTYNLAVRYKDGRFEDISENTGTPDAVMRINEFSAAILGRYAIEDFVYIPEIVVNNLEPLRGIFYKKPIFINNRF